MSPTRIASYSDPRGHGIDAVIGTSKERSGRDVARGTEGALCNIFGAFGQNGFLKYLS